MGGGSSTFSLLKRGDPSVRTKNQLSITQLKSYPLADQALGLPSQRVKGRSRFRRIAMVPLACITLQGLWTWTGADTSTSTFDRFPIPKNRILSCLATSLLRYMYLVHVDEVDVF